MAVGWRAALPNVVFPDRHPPGIEITCGSDGISFLLSAPRTIYYRGIHRQSCGDQRRHFDRQLPEESQGNALGHGTSCFL
ncbi:MAG: hypothetical protein ACM3SS_16820 [Rhodospirillaceae bacterium]